MNTIETSATIHINCQPAKVFAYTAELGNDSAWRSEINATISLHEREGLHHIVEEDAFLSKKLPHYLTRFICTVYIQDRKIIYQLVPGSRFFMCNCREVKALAPQQTLLRYSLKFDGGIVRHALGIGLPAIVIRCVTRLSMRKYLKKLKLLLESGQ